MIIERCNRNKNNYVDSISFPLRTSLGSGIVKKKKEKSTIWEFVSSHINDGSTSLASSTLLRAESHEVRSLN